MKRAAWKVLFTIVTGERNGDWWNASTDHSSQDRRDM